MNWYNGFSPEQRNRAFAWLKKQQSAGLFPLKAKRCMATGQTEGIIDFHSEDYSSPFGKHIGAYQFCYRTHMMIHCRFKSPDAWSAFLRVLRKGGCYRPLFTRDFGAVRSMLSGDVEPDYWGEPRHDLVFDRIVMQPTVGMPDSAPAERSLELNFQ